MTPILAGPDSDETRLRADAAVEIASCHEAGSSLPSLRTRGVRSLCSPVSAGVAFQPLMHNRPVLTGWFALGHNAPMQPPTASTYSAHPQLQKPHVVGRSTIPHPTSWNRGHGLDLASSVLPGTQTEPYKSAARRGSPSATGELSVIQGVPGAPSLQPRPVHTATARILALL